MEQYEIIRSRRKTLALEITRDCRVLVRAPMRLSAAAIKAFVEKHAGWIDRHLARQRKQAASAPPEPTVEEIAALKAAARAILPEKVAYWSHRMGVTPTGIKITTARKRYGSCSGKNSGNRLSFPCSKLHNCVIVQICACNKLCIIGSKAQPLLYCTVNCGKGSNGRKGFSRFFI